MNLHRITVAALAAVLPSCVGVAQAKGGDKVLYVPRVKYPAIEEIRANDEKAREALTAETDRIRARQEAEEKTEKEEKREIQFDFKGVEKPKSLDAFHSSFHFAPVRQYLTGTCWSFSTTSFFESEVYRLTGKKIKLSEMYTVYFEYLMEARRFVRERGKSFFGEGSEGNAVMLVWRDYGIVPASAYAGQRGKDSRYDHSRMAEEMKAYLEFVKDRGLWDEETVLSTLRVILDRHMGPPPERFEFEGKTYTPKEFLADVLQLHLDDYANVMSTLAQPFYAFGEYEVEANWWHSKAYYNVPLDRFYGIIRYAVDHGYTVRLNGDISEPGLVGKEDAAVIPDYDLPRDYINQDSREYRIRSGATVDDHDIHLVGYTRVGDRDWFLIKDSWDSAQLGRFPGYFFYRGDYVRLKMLTFIVHRDAVEAVVPKFETAANPPPK